MLPANAVALDIQERRLRLLTLTALRRSNDTRHRFWQTRCQRANLESCKNKDIASRSSPPPVPLRRCRHPCRGSRLQSAHFRPRTPVANLVVASAGSPLAEKTRLIRLHLHLNTLHQYETLLPPQPAHTVQRVSFALTIIPDRLPALPPFSAPASRQPHIGRSAASRRTGSLKPKHSTSHKTQASLPRAQLACEQFFDSPSCAIFHLAALGPSLAALDLSRATSLLPLTADFPRVNRW